MEIMIFSGDANPPLAEAIAARLGVPLGRRIVARFPDSELHVEIQQSVRGHDIYLVQPTAPPVDLHLMELLFMADACHRAGARRITAIVPYFGYARQDRRGKGREPVSARIASDLLRRSHSAGCRRGPAHPRVGRLHEHPTRAPERDPDPGPDRHSPAG